MSQSTGAALSFGDSLTAAVLERRSQIVLGLDPDPDRLWPQAVAAASGDTPAELAASAVILVHNHPSGDPTPSQADIHMTREIADVARPLGVLVHDHIIVGRHGHASLKGLGLI